MYKQLYSRKNYWGGWLWRERNCVWFAEESQRNLGGQKFPVLKAFEWLSNVQFVSSTVEDHHTRCGESGVGDEGNIHSVGKLLLVSHVLRYRLTSWVRYNKIRGWISIINILGCWWRRNRWSVMSNWSKVEKEEARRGDEWSIWAIKRGSWKTDTSAYNVIEYVLTNAHVYTSISLGNRAIIAIMW